MSNSLYQVDALCPLDGRYHKTGERLARYFSERALMSYRVKMEYEYLIALSRLQTVGVRKFTNDEMSVIHKACSLSVDDAQIIKDIEIRGHKNIPATNHDVKAVEYFIKMKLEKTSLSDVVGWIHFGLTSEDTNNIAYALSISDAIENELLPSIEIINSKLKQLIKENKDTPMFARTHGQPASPTTFGKELEVFRSRIQRQIASLKKFKILVKLNGATGNFNAHISAYPKINWRGFSEKFIHSLNNDRVLKLEVNQITTQIEPHDTYAELFDTLRRINTIFIDLDQDMWRYISDGWITQKIKEGEVGSSTMPHKVNPIDFENSEGNLGIANALLNYFSCKLPISRLQRDLSDSTVERNFGVAFGHSIVGYVSISKGLNKISINKERMMHDLDNHPEIISEAIQTILRKEGVAMPYEALKKLTRGKSITMENIATFIDNLEVKEDVKKRLKKITPRNYIGLASVIAET